MYNRDIYSIAFNRQGYNYLREFYTPIHGNLIYHKAVNQSNVLKKLLADNWIKGSVNLLENTLNDPTGMRTSCLTHRDQQSLLSQDHKLWMGSDTFAYMALPMPWLKGQQSSTVLATLTLGVLLDVGSLGIIRRKSECTYTYPPIMWIHISPVFKKPKVSKRVELSMKGLTSPLQIKLFYSPNTKVEDLWS